MPMPKQVLYCVYCTHVFYTCALQTVFGLGMGANVTAQYLRLRRGRP